MTLARLSPGRRGRIVRVGGSNAIAGRLRELGLCPGTEIRCERRAPLGDPVAYQFRGTLLCLRRSEAALIEIETVSDEAGAPR